MKSPIKKLISILGLGLLVVAMHSCSKEEAGAEFDQKDFSTLQLDGTELDQIFGKQTFNTKSDELSFVKGSHVLVDPSKPGNKFSEDQTDRITVSTTDVDMKNLNRLFPSLPVSIDVLTITMVKDSKQRNTGFILHYTDEEGFLRLAAFQKTEGKQLYQEIDLPISLVSSFTLENTLFVARTLFANSDITTIGASGIQTVNPTNEFDDMSLFRFMAKYNVSTPSIKKSPLFKALRATKDVGIEGPDGGLGRPCALAVHMCNNGSSTRTQCHPFGGGCRAPICARNAAIAAMQSNNMTSQL